MSTGIDRLASQLQKTIDEKDKGKKTGYYSQCEVLKVTEDTVWVKIPGGVDETPVSKTVNAKPGDTVQVRVEGGRAWIAGNYTSPATDDTRANTAYVRAETADEKAGEAIDNASVAKLAAEKAVDDAYRAYQAAQEADANADRAYQAAEEATADAGRALTAAQQAEENASAASSAASQAVADSGRALTAAQQAEVSASAASSDAGRALSAANQASAAASQATTDAGRALSAAERAETDAGRAFSAAEQAEEDAGNAYTAANNAQASANAALGSAIAANIASNSALTQLSVVEDVAAVLAWISEHGTYKLSADTAVVSGKLYFTRSGDDYTLITSPTGNPHANNYYEIDTLGDEAVSNYISSHLALTNAGLWVVKDNSGYKILLANDGMRVYDNQGNLVVTYGASIEVANNREFHIGNQNAYIVFNPDNNGSITIGGSNIQLGSGKTLDEVLAELNNTFIFDVTYTISGTDPNRVANFEAHLYQGGIDIKSQHDETQFTWYLKTEDGEEPIIPSGRNHNHGYTTTVNISDCGYGAEVIAHFTTTENSPLLNNNDDNFTDVNNTPLTGRTESGESVRVRDLSVSTTIFSTDKLLVVGSEDEHLVSVQTLQNYLNSNLDKQVLFNTTSGWDSQLTLVSKANTLYIYTDHKRDSDGNNVAGIKAGDGNAFVVDLPFTDAIAMEHIEDTTRHITSAERTAWNNKVRCYYASGDNLIFTTS